jgi:hypothetical protein
MNEKAIESMNKEEPETALEYLKKVDETLQTLQSSERESSNLYMKACSSNEKALMNTHLVQTPS